MIAKSLKREDLNYDDSYKLDHLLNAYVDFTYYGKMYQASFYRLNGRKDIVFNEKEYGSPAYSVSWYGTSIMEWNNPISSVCIEGRAYDLNSLKLLIDRHKTLIKEVITRQFIKDHPECLYK